MAALSPPPLLYLLVRLSTYKADTIRSLPRNQVPEWASAYINYKGLKKLIKAAAQASKNGEQVDLAGNYGTSCADQKSHVFIDPRRRHD